MNENTVALVVDDSLAVSQALSQILRQNLKFRNVLSANSVEQGLRVFDQNSVDCVLCDIDVGGATGMNGLYFLSEVRKHDRGKDVPFVLMTSRADKTTVDKAIREGVTDFIAKPFNVGTVIGKLQRIGELAQKRGASKPPITVAPSKPITTDTAEPPQRRRVSRITLTSSVACGIAFSPETEYSSELVNISLTGCLVHTLPFNQGGAIYDTAHLSLETGGEPLNISALLRRMEAKNKKEMAADRAMLAAFHFLNLDTPLREAIKALIMRHAPSK